MIRLMATAAFTKRWSTLLPSILVLAYLPAWKPPGIRRDLVRVGGICRDDEVLRGMVWHCRAVRQIETIIALSGLFGRDRQLGRCLFRMVQIDVKWLF